MATNNIIELIQQEPEVPSTLQKVDPNSQETKQPQVISEKLGQGAIPAVLAGFYKLLRTDDGCKKLLATENSAHWLDVLFGENENDAVEKVAQFAAVSHDEAGGYMEHIANKAASLIREKAGNPPTPEAIKTYMNDQRHNILVYLPAEMKMGDALNDESLDDRTNKMEGPISNLMHKIENKFSGGE